MPETFELLIPAKVVPATGFTENSLLSSADGIQNEGEIRQKALSECKSVCIWEIDKDRIGF